MTRKIRVLVVEDSALMRRWLKQLLMSDGEIEVIGTVKDGSEAIAHMAQLRPDVVTLDIDLPGMNGLDVLTELMQRAPVPVVVVTGLEDPEIAQEALTRGAVDVVRKPSGPLSLDLYKIRDELIHKVKTAYRVTLTPPSSHPPDLPRPSLVDPPAPSVTRYAHWAVVIGASTGGPRAVEYILRSLPATLPAVVLVVQHMPPGFTQSFAQRLNQQSALNVCEAADRMSLTPGQALVAPGDYHLRILRAFPYPKVRLEQSPPIKGLRPAIDVTLQDAAEVWGAHTLGVILTGMGQDGLAGARAVKARGGIIIAQDQDTSVVYGMPRAIVQAGVADRVLPLEAIPQAIVETISTATGNKTV